MRVLPQRPIRCPLRAHRPQRFMCAVAANISSRRRSFEAVQKSALITAIKTPYLPSGRFDIEAFDRMVEHQIANGVEGLIVGGTTGEGHLMSWDEHVMLIAHCAIQFKDRILVVGNTGSNSTGEAVYASDQGFCVGMDAALHINPYYGKTSVDGLLRHFKVSLDCGPSIVYNVPSRTGQDIPDEVMYKVAEHENFLGVKECTGNERIGNYTKNGLKCWSGNDDESHAGRHEFNSNGVISVTSNLVPGLFSKLMHGSPDYELNESLNGDVRPFTRRQVCVFRADGMALLCSQSHCFEYSTVYVWHHSTCVSSTLCPSQQGKKKGRFLETPG